MTSTLLQNLWFALRMLSRKPAFAAAAILTLTIGIGANTAVFTIVHSVLLRPLPFYKPDQLVILWEKQSGDSSMDVPQLSYPDLQDIRSQGKVFKDVAAILTQDMVVTGTGEPARLHALAVSPNFFSVLGIPAFLGRTFATDEQPETVVISHSLWQNRYGSDPKLVGSELRLDGKNFTVAGVMPSEFNFVLPLLPSFEISDIDVWIPLPLDPPFNNRAIFTYEAVGRLKEGVSIKQAQADLVVIGKNLQAQYPDSNRSRTFFAKSLHSQVTGNISQALLLLQFGVAIVLLVACANIANLLLTRAVSREKEFAIRRSLGATQKALIQQLLTESMVLALMGGMGGLILAQWLAGLLTRIEASSLLQVTPDLNPGVLGFTLICSIVSGIIFGLAPAWRGSKIKSSLYINRGSAGKQRLRSALVISETALAFILLISAGLLLMSLARLIKTDPGFDSDHVLTFQTSLPEERYPDQRHVVDFSTMLVQNLATLPGVQSVGISGNLPLSGADNTTDVRVQEKPLENGTTALQAAWGFVLPYYFRTMGIPIIRGHDFSAHDLNGSSHVTIINQALADRLFPNEDPIGKHLLYGSPEQQPDWHEIVGVVGNTRHASLENAPDPRAYDLLGQHWDRSLSIAMRTTTDPMSLVGAVRAQVRQMDGFLPVESVQTMDDLELTSIASRKHIAWLLGAFAFTALLLAAIGLYGVMAYLVSERQREIGIRVALGAGNKEILSLILGKGARLTLAGLVLGTVGTLALSRVLSSYLYEVSPTSPGIFLALASVFFLVNLVASLIPARTAMRIQPAEAIACE